MQIKRFVASSLAALMAGATFAGAALAATSVGGVLKTLGEQATAGTPYLVVVGDTAAASDVVGAIDVASALAQHVTKEVAIPGVTVTQVDGIEREVDIVGSGTGDEASEVVLTGGFPSPLRTFHYSGLKQASFNFAGKKYGYHEEVELSDGIKLTHKIDDSYVNGTQKLYIPEATASSFPVTYKFVFEDGLDKDPNYSNILTINLLGKEISIVGVEDGNIKLLAGNVGIADQSTPVKYGDYQIYVVDGSTEGGWAAIQIKDKEGNVAYSDILDKEEVKTYTLGGKTVKVMVVNIWSSTVTNTVKARLAVGEEVEKTYPSCSGFSIDEDYVFPGEKEWYMCFNKAEGNSNTDKIEKNDEIWVVYAPEERKYLTFGEKIVAPNNYFELSMIGWNTNNFATITISPVSGKSIYDESSPLPKTRLSGFEISTDVKGTIGYTSSSATDYYDKVYILLDQYSGSNAEVFIGYWDATKNKIIKIDEKDVDDTENKGDIVTFSIVYASSGEVEYSLTVDFDASNANIEKFMITGPDGTETTAVFLGYELSGWGSGAPAISLGTSNSADDSDIILYSLENPIKVGDKSQDIVTNTPIILVSPATYTASDKVVFKIPAVSLKAKVAFGKIGGVVSEGGTYRTYAPLSLPVAKLASEVTDADKANANIVLVGGPCANALVQQLVDAGKLDASFTCAGGIPGEAWTPGAAYVKVIEDAFATGRIALVVAGTDAADTRLATSLLSQGKLEDQTAEGVKVSGTVTAPVITPM